jgi:hypothetical protein
VTVVPSALVVFDFIGFVISLHGSDHTSSPALARATTVWLEPVIFFCEAFTNILCSGRLLSTFAWQRRTDAHQALSRGGSSGIRFGEGLLTSLAVAWGRCCGSSPSLRRSTRASYRTLFVSMADLE